jgi:serine protease AprX
MLGSGTSQAAAFISGAAALIVDGNPEATPDQVKALLVENSGGRFRRTQAKCYGAGLPSLDWVNSDAHNELPSSVQTHEPATGLGSLEASPRI